MEQRWNKDGSWRSNIPYGLFFFSLFCVWVWVWSCTHQMSELRVGFLFLGLVDHHSRPRCIFEGGVNFLWVSWISLSRRFFLGMSGVRGGGR